MIWTWANLITFVRLAILIIFLWNFWESKKLIALLLLMSFMILDVLDGMIARSFDCVSEIGTIFDHGIDKLFAMSTLLMFYLKQWIPLWMLLMYLLREMFLILGWIIVRIKDKRVLSSKNFGKLAGGFYFMSVALAIMGMRKLFDYFIFITLLLFYLSALNYVNSYLRSRRAK